MDGSEYLKYMTERVVSYMERSEDEESKAARKLGKEPWLSRWFGIAPLGIRVWWASRADKKSKTRREARSANSSDYR